MPHSFNHQKKHIYQILVKCHFKVYFDILSTILNENSQVFPVYVTFCILPESPGVWFMPRLTGQLCLEKPGLN